MHELALVAAGAAVVDEVAAGVGQLLDGGLGGRSGEAGRGVRGEVLRRVGMGAGEGRLGQEVVVGGTGAEEVVVNGGRAQGAVGGVAEEGGSTLLVGGVAGHVGRHGEAGRARHGEGRGDVVGGEGLAGREDARGAGREIVHGLGVETGVVVEAGRQVEAVHTAGDAREVVGDGRAGGRAAAGRIHLRRCRLAHELGVGVPGRVDVPEDLHLEGGVRGGEDLAQLVPIGCVGGADGALCRASRGHAV